MRKHMSRKPTAHEEVICESINSIRKRIITFQYEAEFANSLLNSINDGESESAKELEKGIEMLNGQITALIAKLDFYKAKRHELKEKRMMKELKRYPKTIKMEDLTVLDN